MLFVYPFLHSFRFQSRRHIPFCYYVSSGPAVLSRRVRIMSATLKKMLPFPVSFHFGRFSFGHTDVSSNFGNACRISAESWITKSSPVKQLTALNEYKWCVQIELELSTATVNQSCGKTYHFASANCPHECRNALAPFTCLLHSFHGLLHEDQAVDEWSNNQLTQIEIILNHDIVPARDGANKTKKNLSKGIFNDMSWTTIIGFKKWRLRTNYHYHEWKILFVVLHVHFYLDRSLQREKI